MSNVVKLAPVAPAPEPTGLEDMPVLMSPKTLGEILEVSAASLSAWRKTWPDGKRVGPAFYTPPGTNMIRYSREAVLEWLATGANA